MRLKPSFGQKVLGRGAEVEVDDRETREVFPFFFAEELRQLFFLSPPIREKAQLVNGQRDSVSRGS